MLDSHGLCKWLKLKPATNSIQLAPYYWTMIIIIFFRAFVVFHIRHRPQL